MSIFSAIGDFFKHLFRLARPGLDEFLKKYEGLAIVTLTQLSAVHNGAGLHAWEQQAFDKLKSEISKDVHDLKDNWISIILHLAYEEIKGGA